MGAALWLAAPSSVVTGIPLGVGVFALCLLLVGGLRFARGALPALRV